MAKLKKILLMGVSYVLIAALAIGGTLAYLKDEDSAVNVMTLGNVSIEQIEQERDENGKLVPFTQSKPALPAVGEIAWNNETININGHDYNMFGEKLKNVVDKIVTVKNTGKTEAFVRTIIAIEDPFTINRININDGAVGYTQSPWFVIDIDGVQYSATAFTYDAALKPGESSLPSLLQAYLKSETTNEDCEKLGATWEILTLSQGIQAAGFVDAETALNAGFGEANATNIANWFKGSVSSSAVADDKAFEDALTSDEKTIVVTLNGDVTYDVAAWANEAMGGEVTEQIIINGNGHTITFNQKDSDWNNIVTNGAKLIINNAKITNAGYNDGPWNRHDLNFACDVELNNVVSDKALAFKAGATLNNVTISDANTSDTYAIWIQPNGQTVTLDNVTIDMLACTDGRGIKIDNQYIDDAAKKVTLNVSNTTFKTEEKSAIIVKTPAGAEINIDNIDITGVKVDPINAVWVDEATAAYADLVVVNGANKIVEGEKVYTFVTSASEFWSAVNSGKKDIIVNNANDIVLNAEHNANGANITFNGGTVTTANTDYTGIAHSGEITYNNVTFNGGTFLYGEKVVFNNCTFNLTTNYVWTYGAKEVEFNGCTFNTDGKAILYYQEASNDNKLLTVKDCTFNATKAASTWNGIHIAAVSIDGSLPNGGSGTFTVNFEGTNTIDADFNGLWQIKAGAANVTVNE